MQHPRARLIRPVRPASFAELMAIYERNYLLFRQLFPGRDSGVIYRVNFLGQHYRIGYSLLERGPYTSTALLTYSLLDHRKRLLARLANAKIRLYHDARQAEVLCPERQLRAISGYTGTGTGVVRLRWSLNMFLNKVLTFSPPARQMDGLFPRRWIQ